RLILDVLAGLGAAHSATSERGRPLEIVHRDVSPQNVIAGTDGIARIVDFGIAKAEGKLSVTRDGEIKGKLAYMAPEQLRAGEVDRRADLYATGVMLWELVTGRRLFHREAEDLGAAIAEVLANAVPAPRTHVDLPEALEAVILRALAADRSARFESADAMAAALEAAAPAATAKEVGAFVMDLGGPALERRDELLANVEQLSAIHEVGVPQASALETAKTEITSPRTERLTPAVTERLAPAITQPLAPAVTERLAPAITQPLAPAVTAGAPAAHAIVEVPEAAAAPARPPTRAGRSRWLVLAALVVAGVAAFFVLRQGPWSERRQLDAPAPESPAASEPLPGETSSGASPDERPGHRNRPGGGRRGRPDRRPPP
ncbi:MAG TPA: serine/threonine-protein kinase, partial [Labilithrix sp.]|nr:serine/threonine-protein kinase [Labilithrix sp.]